ncbi:MAG: GYD domain-containing protein [Candidatus Aminicenantes bacterium]|nr:GYD domain-containing protein [Candidatus Aminicenantes bacterium]
METYVILMGMTEKGLDEIHKIPGFVESLSEKMKKKNVVLKGFYKVMGEIDYVAIIESKNDIDALGAVMAMGKSEYFTTTTLKAYSMPQMKDSIDIYQNNFS